MLDAGLGQNRVINRASSKFSHTESAINMKRHKAFSTTLLLKQLKNFFHEFLGHIIILSNSVLLNFSSSKKAIFSFFFSLPSLGCVAGYFGRLQTISIILA